MYIQEDKLPQCPMTRIILSLFLYYVGNIEYRRFEFFLWSQYNGKSRLLLFLDILFANYSSYLWHVFRYVVVLTLIFTYAGLFAFLLFMVSYLFISSFITGLLLTSLCRSRDQVMQVI